MNQQDCLPLGSDIYSKKSVALKKYLFILLLTTMVSSHLTGQRDSLAHKVYHIKHPVDIPVTILTSATAFGGFILVDKKPTLDSLTIIGLDANDINRFDRSATWQDTEFAPVARSISDVTLGVSSVLPFFLFLDDKIRKDWGDVLLLYLETQAIVGKVVASGGVVAHNPIMQEILTGILKTQVFLPPNPQHIGALGAALTAAEICQEVS